ncbi:DUF1643 domain-containing protein [Rhizobium phage RHph_Y2_17_1]|nr:DUF1643 domain-containing protein [Rhizobium phage RHph_Y2_11]QIG75867.1 DUF1643 domain-containing protein [Rhizobium phage RHph_Y2_17_1]
MTQSSAIFSECGLYRYRLDRVVADTGITIAFFGVNGSKAGVVEEDHTTMKWRQFTRQNGGRRYIAGNPFGKTATNVKELALYDDPVGPDNDRHLTEIIAEADLLVPCCGSRLKLPRRLRPHLDALYDRLFASGKPVKIFGLTQSGDPQHPLTLPYSTQLVDWVR